MMFKKIVLLLIIGFAAQNKAHSNHQNNLSNHLTATCKHLFDQGYSSEQIAQIVSKNLSTQNYSAKTKFFNQFKCSKEKVISFAIGASMGAALVALGSSCLYICSNSTKEEDSVDSKTAHLQTEHTELKKQQVIINEKIKETSIIKENLLTARKNLVAVKKEVEEQSKNIKQQLDLDCAQLLEIDKKITDLQSNKKSTDSLIKETNENLATAIENNINIDQQTLSLLNEKLANQQIFLTQITSDLEETKKNQITLQKSIAANSKEFGCLQENIASCDASLEKCEDAESVLNNSLDELNNEQLLNTLAIEKINHTLNNPKAVIDEL